MKLCIKCTFFKKHYMTCLHEKATDLVTGDGTDCYTERADEMRCGKQGYNWKPLDMYTDMVKLNNEKRND